MVREEKDIVSKTQNTHPLEGLKVLDFTRVVAGPFASRILSDLGADVVKVEPPEGDLTRTWGAVIGGVPGMYNQQNAGKRNICIDLRSDGAKELVYELVAEADIVMENFRPGVMDHLGLSYETLKAINPRLIMLSISGFGSDGPEAKRPAYAGIVHAELGMIARLAERGNVPPTDLPLSVADTNAGLHGVIGLLSAVIQRQMTGLGQHVEVTMMEASLFTDDFTNFGLEKSGDTSPVTNEIWQTGAGPFMPSGDFRYIWKLLTSKIGIEDPTAGMSLEEKIETRRRIAGEYFLGLATWDEVDASMATMNIAWGKVRAPEDVINQETIRHRGAIVQIDDRSGGTRPLAQSPYHFSEAASGVRGPAPHRGEHNSEVLADWLKAGEDRAIALRTSGVLVERE